MEQDKAQTKATLRFVVMNFSKLREVTISPPTFIRNLPWKIKVIPRNVCKVKGGVLIKALGFFLECNFESRSSAWFCNAVAHLKLISRKKGVENFIREVEHLFYYKESDWGFHYFMEWNDVLNPENGYIKDDTVIFEVNVTTDAPYEISEEQTWPYSNLRLAETELLSKNLKDLMTNEDNCDVVLHVQGKEFKAHKFLLIARSSVFAAMFRYDTSEKKTGEVVIPDCDPDSFEKFLEYLYTGILENISFNCAIHLYCTSDKYNVLELKAFCIKYLMQNLTLQNICDAASLADKYNEINLLAATQNFFDKNLEEIIMTSEWQDLMKNNSYLTNKLLQKV